MNKTEFKREVKRINMPNIEEKNPELAKNLQAMSDLVSKPDSGVFDAETEEILDNVFNIVKQNPEFIKGKLKVTVDKSQILKKQGLQLVKQRRKLRKKVEQGDKTASKELLALVKQRRQWQKEINGKFEEGGKINKVYDRTTLRNTTGTKAVNISRDTGYGLGNPIYRAFYVQIYNRQEELLDSKSFNSFKMAEKWAKKKLN